METHAYAGEVNSCISGGLFWCNEHGNPLNDLSSRIQNALGKVAVIADYAYSLGARRVVCGERRCCGATALFISFSFHGCTGAGVCSGVG